MTVNVSLFRALFSCRCDATASPCHDVVQLLSLAELNSPAIWPDFGPATSPGPLDVVLPLQCPGLVYLPPQAARVGRHRHTPSVRATPTTEDALGHRRSPGTNRSRTTIIDQPHPPPRCCFGTRDRCVHAGVSPARQRPPVQQIGRSHGLQRRRAATSRRLIYEAVQRRPLFTWIGHRPSHAVRQTPPASAVYTIYSLTL
jgi:hypothetical protein